MNIFYLSHKIDECVQYHLDKHVVKMPIEQLQLLSTAHRVLDGEEYTDLTANGRRIKRWRLPDDREQHLMKASHINHPSGIWCRDNDENYQWLFNMTVALLKEYTHRYGKTHACEKYLPWLKNTPNNIKKGSFYPPTPAMPIECKVLAEDPQPGRKYDSLKSYHKYYVTEKIRFAKWKNRPVPEWFHANI